MTDEFGPEREERLIAGMLRERGAIDPGRLGPVIDLAALGLVNSAWRNTCVEGWHAEGRLHDGDMMRVSSHMTWRARQILHRWMTETGLAADGPLSALDDIAAEDVEWLAIRVLRWLVNPSRRLITGVTLAELARGDLLEYEDDASLRLGGFARQAADRGARFGMARTAAHGALACPHWWGHPRWPDLVDRLLLGLAFGAAFVAILWPAAVAALSRWNRFLIATRFAPLVAASSAAAAPASAADPVVGGACLCPEHGIGQAERGISETPPL
jgi:hypothetical protein